MNRKSFISGKNGYRNSSWQYLPIYNNEFVIYSTSFYSVSQV